MATVMDKLFWKGSGHCLDGSAWAIVCKELDQNATLQTGTSRRNELVAKMFRLERREEIKGLLSVLFNIPPTTHSFTLARRSSKGWLVLHQSAIRNSAKYLHPTEQREINPQEIAQGICNLWQFLLSSDDGFPSEPVRPFLTPGEDAWMFWAGALVRKYYDFTRGGVARRLLK